MCSLTFMNPLDGSPLGGRQGLAWEQSVLEMKCARYSVMQACAWLCCSLLTLTGCKPF